MLVRRVYPTLLILTALSCWPALGQTSTGSQTSSPPQDSPAPAPQATAAPASDGPPMTFGKVDFSLIMDGYYSFNNNHPVSGFNQLYNFNDKTNQIGLNMIKGTAVHDPDPIGFRVDVGAGRSFDLVKTPAPDPSGFRYLEQAYVSFKPKPWKGFEADFGEFVTSAGAEVIESKDNWNYSRSILFAWAIPYYHFGVRTSMPIGNSLSVGVQLVNGWNAIVENHGNNMQTVGITAAITRKKYTWSHNYYVGPQYTGVNNKNRNLYDTTLLLTPSDKISAYLNFDYGWQNRPISGSDHWIGFAGALRFQLNKHIAISPRAEYFNDTNGFSTGVQQKLHEVTVTGEYKVVDGFLARLEYRHDGSNVPFFNRGNDPAVSQTQNTVTLGLIVYYPAKHQ
jgi:Putative beta-barrel porin-2, OmpL-like. bbp2